MTLDQFVTLCKTYRDISEAGADQLDFALDGRYDQCSSNTLRKVRVWLEDVERVAWNDEELGDAVTGTLSAVTEALAHMEREERR